MGFPLAAIYKPGKEDVKAKCDRFSFYVQDTWNINERLTINPGIRFDYSTGKNDALDTIHDYKTISPRFGFVYALTPDKKTTIKGNYGKFYENPILFFPDLFHKGMTPTTLYLYNPWTGNYDIPIPGSLTEYQFLNELKSPYVNEFLLGIEREILPNLSASLTGIYRKTEDIIEDVETNLLYENPDMPYIPTGSKDGTWLAVYSVGNPDEAYREYKGLELALNKRLSNNWMLMANYTLSETKGTVATSFTGYLDSPGDTINRKGYLSVDRRHIVKVAANYIFPYGINLGIRYQLLSGLPYTKSLYNPFYGYYGVYETPLGGKDPETEITRRYPTQHLFDLRVEKTFRIDKYNFGVYVDIFNLFNTDTPISYYTSDNPLYETVSQRISPVNARINLRFFF
jgi:outer membrane receptor protein involved in Fe transport